MMLIKMASTFCHQKQCVISNSMLLCLVLFLEFTMAETMETSNLLWKSPDNLNNNKEAVGNENGKTEMNMEPNSLVNERLQLIEKKNQDQDNEIGYLKNNLASILDMLGDEKIKEITIKKNPLKTNRRERAARLFPVKLLTPRSNESLLNNDNEPTSCKDLNQMGHTINGIFLVKPADGNNKNNATARMEVVFCNFSPPSSKADTRKAIGSLNVKNSRINGIYFYVQRSMMNDDNSPKVVIFNVLRFNIGGAMDMSKGLFTAPTSGIYQFSFSIMKDGYATGEMHVHLRVNGAKIGNGVSNAGFYAGLSSFQSILALKKGDRVDLYKSQARINHDVANSSHFTGMLLEEHLKEF